MLREESIVPNGNFDLRCSDAVDWLRSLPSNSLDLVVTDPPYESLEKYRALGTTTRLKHSKSSSNDWFKIFPNERFKELLVEIYRVLKDNSHFYLFCDAETMFVVKPIAEDVGFRFWKPIIWDKVRIGMGYHYRSRYETILFFEKGKRKLNDLSIPDILQAPRIHKGYPTEKPVSLMEILINQSTNSGDVVADPFMGSGSVGVASLKLDRKFVGNDVSREACAIAQVRLADAKGPIRELPTRPVSRAPEPAILPLVRDASRKAPVRDSVGVSQASVALNAETKVCPKCSRTAGREVVKPLDQFGTRVMRNGAVKLQSYCKACR